MFKDNRKTAWECTCYTHAAVAGPVWQTDLDVQECGGGGLGFENSEDGGPCRDRISQIKLPIRHYQSDLLPETSLLPQHWKPCRARKADSVAGLSLLPWLLASPPKSDVSLIFSSLAGLWECGR